MPRVLQVVTTRNFAGAERYVATLAASLPSLGWDATVVGGDEAPMRAALPAGIEWLPGGTPFEAVRSVARAGRFDLCHVHMTYAEAVGVALRRVHGAPVVATRHFAAHRGSSVPGRLLAGPIARGLATEIAISAFVASQLEGSPRAVIVNGVAAGPALWHPSSRVVLVLQRLEQEKDTETALRAWALSGLAARGWSLRVVGAGARRPALEALVVREHLEGVTFVGWVGDVERELAGAGMVLASAPREPLGLSVLEAMAAGVPVVAAAGGGHLETVGAATPDTLFPPGDAAAAARALAALAEDDDARADVSARVRAVQRSSFDLDGHARRVVDVYGTVAASAAPVGPTIR